jgi:hypothetical protein
MFNVRAEKQRKEGHCGAAAFTGNSLAKPKDLEKIIND